MRLTRSSGQFQVKSAYQKTVCFPGTSCRFSLVNKASSTLAVCVCVIRDPGPHAHSTGVSQAVACHPLWEVLEPLSWATYTLNRGQSGHGLSPTLGGTGTFVFLPPASCHLQRSHWPSANDLQLAAEREKR